MKGNNTFRVMRDEAMIVARSHYHRDWLMYHRYIERAKRYHSFLMQSIREGVVGP